MRLSGVFALRMLWAAAAATAVCATDGQPAAEHAGAARRDVLRAEQVVQILDETLDWYRTLGTQQQSATQPSDLLILYANRQTADRVIALAFDIARANAELLSSEADDADAAGPKQSGSDVEQLQSKADQRRQGIMSEMDATRRALSGGAGARQSELSAKLSELQGELDMVNAQKNMLDTIAQFASENDARRAGVTALKAHIDAIAASIPSATAGGTSTRGGASTSVSASDSAGSADTGETTAPRGIGLWDLSAEALRLSQKISTIEAIDRRTAALQATFSKLREKPVTQLEALSARSDSLAADADHAGTAGLRSVRDQFDTLAWLFTQTSQILIPLSKESVLLDQYRQNLHSWRDAAMHQYHEVLTTLATRVLILVAVLAVVFLGAEFWRRTVLKYEHEPRRRYQLLLARKLVLWSTLIVILGIAFISKLSSFATFAGLITAGVAVAMQSVLVSVVGYFFLIGKYGVRVGDHVQVGSVIGEVIDLGLVRMHLMELSSQGTPTPTGRVVAFANSIVFQASGGLFRQLPGVNFAWHEATFGLPAGADYVALKDKLLAALTEVVGDYHEEIVRQTREIQRTTASRAYNEVTPQVQLQYSPAGVEARARYPVHSGRAAEIDERVAQRLLAVIERFAVPAPATA
jgi:small-conductance mechanosensitive channel